MGSQVVIVSLPLPIGSVSRKKTKTASLKYKTNQFTTAGKQTQTALLTPAL